MCLYSCSSFIPADTTTSQPKAGQGMNTAFLDAQNLAWKIHAVEGGFASRELLKTYEPERKKVAERLLDFDNRYAKLFSQQPPGASTVEAATDDRSSAQDEEKEEENEFIKAFKEACEFTSGYGVFYETNELNWTRDRPATSIVVNPPGTKLTPGRLFPNSNVTRVADANAVHLEQEVPLNGSFRIFIFAGEPAMTRQALRDFNDNLKNKRSFFSTYLRKDIETVSHHEQHNPHSLFFTLCTIFATKRASVEISRDVPDLLARYRQHVYADDRLDVKVLGAKASAHMKMGFDEQKGGVVVVRPDGYIGMVAGLVEGRETVDALDEYFSGFCTRSLGGAGPSL